MKNKLLPYTLFLLVATVVMAVAFLNMYNKQPREIIKQDTVIHTRIDTIRDTITQYKLKPYPKETLKRDTLYLKDTTLYKETKYYEERFYLGKDTADVSLLTTGINTTIDSIGIKLRTMRTNTTNTVEIIKYVEGKKKKIQFGLQGGYGYGFNSRQLEPYIGIGLQINL